MDTKLKKKTDDTELETLIQFHMANGNLLVAEKEKTFLHTVSSEGLFLVIVGVLIFITPVDWVIRNVFGVKDETHAIPDLWKRVRMHFRYLYNFIFEPAFREAVNNSKNASHYAFEKINASWDVVKREISDSDYMDASVFFATIPTVAYGFVLIYFLVGVVIAASGYGVYTRVYTVSDQNKPVVTLEQPQSYVPSQAEQQEKTFGPFLSPAQLSASEKTTGFNKLALLHDDGRISYSTSASVDMEKLKPHYGDKRIKKISRGTNLAWSFEDDRGNTYEVNSNQPIIFEGHSFVFVIKSNTEVISGLIDEVVTY